MARNGQKLITRELDYSFALLPQSHKRVTTTVPICVSKKLPITILLTLVEATMSREAKGLLMILIFSSNATTITNFLFIFSTSQAQYMC
jgi:hypothetical protein